METAAVVFVCVRAVTWQWGASQKSGSPLYRAECDNPWHTVDAKMLHDHLIRNSTDFFSTV